MKKYKVTVDAYRATGHCDSSKMIVEAEDADKAKRFVLNHAGQHPNGALKVRKVEEVK